MQTSEQANLPRFRGAQGFYEIWFLVVFEPGKRRATWLRYTMFTPAPGLGGDSRAILWAASFDAAAEPRAIAVKKIFPFEKLSLGARDRFDVSIDGNAIGHGFCRGSAASPEHRLAWDLRFRPRDHEVARTPRIADHLPLPTHAAHANDRVPFEGWIEVDGARRSLEGAVGTQTHIWGTRRIEELSWIHAPSFAENGAAALEVIVARPRARAPRTTSLFLTGEDLAIDLTDLPFALTSRAREQFDSEAALLDIRATSPRTMVNVRARCDPRTLVGYVYRDPRGQDLYVAQSDLASCEVHIYRRHRALLEPDRTLTCDGGAALEFHGPQPIPGVRYIAWDDELAPEAPQVRAAAPRDASPVARKDDAFEELPEIREVIALGLTYREHVRETASEAAPAAFRKERRSLLIEGDRVRIPTMDEMLQALEEIEPGLARALTTRFRFVPPMMDYEAELAMVVLGPTSREELARPRFAPRIGWTVANDLTARACQVLGSGKSDPMPYWSVSKSFPGFLPMTSRMYVPRAEGELPDVVLTTRVNGELRQETRARDLLHSPRELLSFAAASLGRDLERGDLVLTGTPAGVAFSVSRARRWVGERFLDRFGRLRASMLMAAASDRFLHAGDLVEVDAGFLGRRAVRLEHY